MTSKRSLLILLPVLAIAVFLMATRNDEEQVANDLAKRQKAATAIASASPADLIQSEIRLSSTLLATQDAGKQSWFIDSEKSGSFIEIPFRPSPDGFIPPPKVTKETPANAQRSNPGYVGANACAECHQQKHAGFVHTAHHRTSGLVAGDNVAGAFAAPQNEVLTSDDSLKYRMLAEGSQRFQQIDFADMQFKVPMDVFTGSAKSGQSYLYWHGDALFQDHVSYLAGADQWIPSPGFQDNHVSFSRVIRLACLECHTTYVKEKRAPNFYHADSAIWGISCERCHGPGQQHVDYHHQNPEAKKSMHIVHPKSLSRQSQLDICGQCHSGSFRLLGDAFSYRPGDDLSKHHELVNPDAQGVGGIHTSNQLTRLSMSKCFKESEMTCTTCHNPHQNERGKTSVFTEACKSCHEVNDCGKFDQLGAAQINEQCISCHMPIGKNESMKIQVSRGSFTVEMIDHYIRIDQ
ncbi:MAG: multiheme c-type cytochrome [Rubripirellula sp.]